MESNATQIVNAIVADAISRDAGKTDEEIKASLGLEDSEMSASELVRIALFNLIVEKCKELLRIKNALNDIFNVIKIYNEEGLYGSIGKQD